MHKLSVPLAFLAAILIWSTTPLAVQWSSGNAPLTSVLLRMVLGASFCGLIMFAKRTYLPLDRAARNLYLVSGLSIFGAMSLIYWGAQSIPSGWIAVIYGLSPLFTGLFSLFIEPERQLTPARIFGILLGFFGLYLVFKAGLSINENTINGVIILVISVIISSSSAVLARQLASKIDLSGMQITMGGLIVAIPLFFISALIFDPITDISYSSKAVASILYLGIIGTGIGFSLYYFLLKNTSASNVSMITLITPITALFIGSWLNNEPVIADIWVGAGCVCLGLLLYQYKPRYGFRKN